MLHVHCTTSGAYQYFYEHTLLVACYDYSMDEFFRYDPLTIGSKGLVFIGSNVLVYQRDSKTDAFPLQLDLPGGGPEGKETPFETFRREVQEEFGLLLKAEDIVYVRKYPSVLAAGKFAYFPVAKLPESAAATVHFGEEGLEYFLMSLEEYLGQKSSWSVLQERARDYRKASGVKF